VATIETLNTDFIGGAGVALAGAFELRGMKGIQLPSTLALLLRADLPAQPKTTSRFPPALAIIENKLPNRRVNLHHEHSFDLPSSRGLRRSCTFADPVTFYSTAAHNLEHILLSAHEN